MDRSTGTVIEDLDVGVDRPAAKPRGRPGKATTGQQVVTIDPLRLGRVKLTLASEGDGLIMHRFSEKGGIEELRKKHWQIGDMTKKKRDAKDPIGLFVAAMHTMPGSSVKVHGSKEGFLKGNKVTASGKFCIPFAYLKGAIESAAPDVNGITKAQVRRAIRIVETWVPLKCSNPWMREDTVSIGGMNKTTDLRYRPQFDRWEATFTVEYNTGVMALNTVVNLFNIAGFAAGIGEWRPEKGGEFGRFHVKGK